MKVSGLLNFIDIALRMQLTMERVGNHVAATLSQHTSSRISLVGAANRNTSTFSNALYQFCKFVELCCIFNMQLPPDPEALAVEQEPGHGERLADQCTVICTFLPS